MYLTEEYRTKCNRGTRLPTREVAECTSVLKKKLKEIIQKRAEESKSLNNKKEKQYPNY